MNVREWALPVYTILMQIAIGAFTAHWFVYTFYYLKHGRNKAEKFSQLPLVIVLVTVVAAMIGAHFHLSKPFFSFFSMMNIRSSWLSREILSTVIFFNLLIFVSWMLWRKVDRFEFLIGLGWLTIFSGWVTEYCISQIYQLPTQVAWNNPMTSLLFLSSTVLLGAVAYAAMLIIDLKYAEIRNQAVTPSHTVIVQKVLRLLAVIAVIMAIMTVAGNYQQILFLQKGDDIAQISLQLLLDLYEVLFGLRLFALIAGVCFFAGVIYFHTARHKPLGELMKPVFVTYLFILIGEILGRFLFYATHIRIGI